MGLMTVDEPPSHPDRSEKAQTAIARTMAEQDRAARHARQIEHVNKILVPDDTFDRLLNLYIVARRRVDGITRPMKPDQLAHEKKMARMNQAVMALLRGAYRAGIYDTLYRTLDQEDPT